MSDSAKMAAYRKKIVYSYADLKFAQDELERIRADQRLRESSANGYRVAVIAAQTMVNTIMASLERQQKAKLRSGRKRMKPPVHSET